MKKITNLEYQCLAYLLAFPLFMGIGISKMIRDVGSDVWISMIIGTILGLFIKPFIINLALILLFKLFDIFSIL